MNKILLLFLSLGICNLFSVHAQTGVFYFASDENVDKQATAVAIVQEPNDSLILINLQANEDYTNQSLLFLKTKIDGTVGVSKIIPIENLHNFVYVSRLNQTNYKVFGNQNINKHYQPFQLKLTNSGKLVEMESEASVFSTLTSHVAMDKDFYYILYTKNGKNERYNISLLKLAVETNKVVWLKKISSEQNEEADQIYVTENGTLYILGKKFNDDVSEYLPIIYKLDATGNQLWKKGIDVPANFNKQTFLITPNQNIIYMCAYTKLQTGMTETRLIKFSDEGTEMHHKTIDDLSANGMLKLTNDQLVLFGSKFYVNQKQVVTKGSFTLLGSGFNELLSKTLDQTDTPDTKLNLPVQTSSDFTTAIELHDGRIAFAGKVFMTLPQGIKRNVPLLMITNADGTYQKN
ncbi:MAG: hypothetical protein CVU09_08050 [Bacteroidetes bacterium HGW-Bacteroidetes-4]|jgi:hypothetical protein|nr:MAG: hypothetical protein CVU09_08050 [Bacteroidetes bacterium HGW-Bacteroidetes-4]